MAKSVKEVIENVMSMHYDDGMTVFSITMPQSMKNRLDKEVGGLIPTDEVSPNFIYKGDFKEITIIVGDNFSVEAE